MKKPQLIIETPRAGKYNHRFIVSQSYTGQDQQLSYLLDIARNQQPGVIAVNHKVLQPATGREALEWLVLVEIDVECLSPQQQAAIQDVLAKFLPKVASLVKTVPWDKIYSSIGISDELNKWLEQVEQILPQKSLPYKNLSPKQNNRSSKNWIWGGGIILLLGLLLGFGLEVTKKYDVSTNKLTESKQPNFSQNPSSSNNQATNLTSKNIETKSLIDKKTSSSWRSLRAIFESVQQDLQREGYCSKKKTKLPAAIPDSWHKYVSQYDNVLSDNVWPLGLFLEGFEFSGNEDGFQNQLITKEHIKDLMLCWRVIRNFSGKNHEDCSPILRKSEWQNYLSTDTSNIKPKFILVPNSECQKILSAHP